MIGFDWDSDASHLSGSGSIEGIETVEDWGEYYESYSYGTTETYYTTQVYYSEPELVYEGEEMVGGDVVLPPAEDEFDLCTNANFYDTLGDCAYYEDSISLGGGMGAEMICPMSVDYAAEPGITALACCDVCAGI